MLTPEKPVLGISSCLLGERVRFDSGHKRDAWLVDRFGRYVEFRPFCPEVAIGLGIPRPPIRLVGEPGDMRAVGVKDGSLDVTEQLETYALETLAHLQDVSGYVFKSKSPSCGMERVKLYDAKGMPSNHGVGIYARVIMEAQPHLPVEEEGRLHDPVLRENFVNRVFVYQRWQRLRRAGLRAAALVEFHARHKYMVMAHSQAAYQRMGRLLSHLKGVDLERVADQYEAELMTALQRRVNRARHVNVLQHMQGYLKQAIDAGDKQELAATIEAYRRGEVPFVVPMALLRHHFRRSPDPYIRDQWYLEPYPDDLGLRNAI
jgi:uncharacterized protein YbgA (DUF1722 family)/uncharacterized protein YbbK (DUF523 family)